VDLADLLTVAKDIANRTVWATFGLPDRLTVGRGENVLPLDDDAARLGELVDSI
jgi:hypothetical protein